MGEDYSDAGFDQQAEDTTNDRGGLSDGAFFAIAIVLFILAGIAWYVALHPGGIRDASFVTDSNSDGKAQNAAEVVTYFMNKLTHGQTQDTSLLAAEKSTTSPKTTAKEKKKEEGNHGRKAHRHAKSKNATLL